MTSRTKTGGLVLSVLLALAPASADQVQPIASDAAIPRFRPLPSANQRIAGMLANRYRSNAEGFLQHCDPNLLARSTGEAPGLYLQASAAAYEYTPDARLRSIMDKVADGVIAMRTEDPAILRTNLLGLFAYYRATGEEKAYDAGRKIGDLVRETKDQQSDSVLAGGLASGLLELYRFTADPEYLALAKTFVRHFLAKRAELAEPVDQAALPGILEAYSAVMDLYRVTGDELMLRDAAIGWTSLAKSIAGPERTTVSACVIAEWARLTRALFEANGQARYGDELERVVYNDLLALQSISTGALCAELPAAGRKNFLPQAEGSVSRCALVAARAIASLPNGIWGQHGNGIAINLYTAARGSFALRRRALVQVYEETSFPEHGDVTLHIEPSRSVSFPLYLRVPEWTDNFMVEFGGNRLLGRSGELLTIEHVWRRGDSVRISIAMRTHLRRMSDGTYVLQRGPQLLSLGHTTDGSQALIDLEQMQTPDWQPKLKESVGYPAMEPQYEIPALVDGKRSSLLMLPLADAAAVRLALQAVAPGRTPSN